MALPTTEQAGRDANLATAPTADAKARSSPQALVHIDLPLNAGIQHKVYHATLNHLCFRTLILLPRMGMQAISR